AAGTAETNNTGTGSFAAAARNYPNLVATLVSVPTAGDSGGLFALRWSVTNTGTVAASGSWTDRLVLSVDGVISNDDIILVNTVHAGGLAAGATYEDSVTVRLPPNLDGTFRVVFATDFAAAVIEPDTRAD